VICQLPVAHPHSSFKRTGRISALQAFFDEFKKSIKLKKKKKREKTNYYLAQILEKVELKYIHI
jgi:hypothetical protein